MFVDPFYHSLLARTSSDVRPVPYWYVVSNKDKPSSQTTICTRCRPLTTLCRFLKSSSSWELANFEVCSLQFCGFLNRSGLTRIKQQIYLTILLPRIGNFLFLPVLKCTLYFNLQIPNLKLSKNRVNLLILNLKMIIEPGMYIKSSKLENESILNLKVHDLHQSLRLESDFRTGPEAILENIKKLRQSDVLNVVHRDNRNVANCVDRIVGQSDDWNAG
jgi:hypothetical protein